MSEPRLPFTVVAGQEAEVPVLPDAMIEALRTGMQRPLSPTTISPDGAARMAARVNDLSARLGTRIIDEARAKHRATVEGADVDRAFDALTGKAAANAQNFITYATACGGGALTLFVAIMTTPSLNKWWGWVLFALMVGSAFVLTGISRKINP